jgi:hypothetical protein
MTADKHETQCVVADFRFSVQQRGCFRQHLLDVRDDVRLLRRRHLAMSQGVAGKIDRDPCDPSGGVGWNSTDRPRAHGLQQSSLRYVFDQSEVPRTEHAGQRTV